jgi:hypothetical protein
MLHGAGHRCNAAKAPGATEDSGHPHPPPTGTGCCATVEIISPCRFVATIVIFVRQAAP